MKHSSEGVILVRKCNVFWESNLNAFKISTGFYRNQFYTGAVPLTSQEWTAIGASANTLVWVGSSTFRYITLMKALRNILLPGGDFEGEGGASQAGLWLLVRQLSPAVWATGTVETSQMMAPSRGVKWGRTSSLTKPVLRNLLGFTLAKWWSGLIFNKLWVFWLR